MKLLVSRREKTDLNNRVMWLYLSSVFIQRHVCSLSSHFIIVNIKYNIQVLLLSSLIVIIIIIIILPWMSPKELSKPIFLAPIASKAFTPTPAANLMFALFTSFSSLLFSSLSSSHSFSLPRLSLPLSSFVPLSFSCSSFFPSPTTAIRE